MLEFVLVVACATGKGCTEATASYFHYRPDMREALHRQEVRLVNLMTPVVVQYAVPVLACVARDSCSVKIGGNFYLERDSNRGAIAYRVGF